MRRFICISIVFISTLSVQIQAQYQHNKHFYSPSSYEYHYDDKYNPGLCGMASLAVPGLGQIIAGESGRGVVVLCSAVGAYIVSFSGVVMMEGASSIYSSSYRTGAFIFLGGLASTLAVDIYAIVDAVRVAKVNNLAIRDERKSSLSFKPSINAGPTGELNPGIALTLNF